MRALFEWMREHQTEALFVVTLVFCSTTIILAFRASAWEAKYNEVFEASGVEFYEVLAERIISSEDNIPYGDKHLFMEYAYMEGQLDALSGDVRVQKIDDDWEWIRSPWDGFDVSPRLQSFESYRDYIEFRF